MFLFFIVYVGVFVISVIMDPPIIFQKTHGLPFMSFFPRLSEDSSGFYFKNRDLSALAIGKKLLRKVQS